MRSLPLLSSILILFILPSHSEDSLFICNQYTCPKGRGVCKEDNTCACLRGYSTIDSTKHGDFYCNYKKKSQVVAFLLEFIMSFGSGHFYVGNYIIGVLKMIFTAFTCLLFCQFHSLIKITEVKRYIRKVELTCLCIWAGWQVLDAVVLGLGLINDSNGIAMKGW